MPIHITNLLMREYTESANPIRLNTITVMISGFLLSTVANGDSVVWKTYWHSFWALISRTPGVRMSTNPISPVSSIITPRSRTSPASMVAGTMQDSLTST